MMHVDRAGDKRRLAADGDRQRMQRIIDRSERRALGHLPQGRSRRVLPLGQSINPVVEQQDVDVEIPPDGVHQVVAADRQGVAVAGDHPHRQVGPAGLQPGGHGRRPTMNRVDAVGVHVIGKPAGTTDAGDEDDLFGRHAQRRQDLLHLGQNRIVPTARAPANFLIAGKILGRQDRQNNLGTHGSVPCSGQSELIKRLLSLVSNRRGSTQCLSKNGTGTSRRSALRARLRGAARSQSHFFDGAANSSRIFVVISRIVNGLPWILFSPTAGTKNSPESTAAVAPGSIPESARARNA